MILLDIYKEIEKIPLHKFYIYLGSIGFALFIIIGGPIYWYYQTYHNRLNEIENLTDSRLQATNLINRMNSVKQQSAHMNKVLAIDPNFKISEFFQNIIEKVKIAEKQLKSESSVSSEITSNAYRADVIRTKFTGMNMKELTELLQELENNPRIRLERLEIAPSKKQTQSIDVTIGFAALQPTMPATAE